MNLSEEAMFMMQSVTTQNTKKMKIRQSKLVENMLLNYINQIELIHGRVLKKTS